MSEHRRRCGLDPIVGFGAVPPVEIAKKLDPFSVGVIPPVESAKKIAAPPREPEAQASSARPNSGIPAAGEHRFVPDEVLVELSPDVSPQTADAIARRERLRLLASPPRADWDDDVPLPDRRPDRR